MTTIATAPMTTAASATTLPTILEFSKLCLPSEHAAFPSAARVDTNPVRRPASSNCWLQRASQSELAGTELGSRRGTRGAGVQLLRLRGGPDQNRCGSERARRERRHAAPLGARRARRVRAPRRPALPPRGGARRAAAGAVGWCALQRAEPSLRCGRRRADGWRDGQGRAGVRSLPDRLADVARGGRGARAGAGRDGDGGGQVDDGHHRAMRRAALLACVLALAGASTAQAASPFAWRGVIEGMYGPPWDHGMRMRMLAFMGAHGMNAYVHAPKDDLYQRTQWRDPYPAAQMADSSGGVASARSHGGEWVPNLSPGVPLIPTPRPPEGAPSRDVCFSCPADLDAVVAKLAPFAGAGARTFMVSFDDVQKVLTHPEDLAAYGSGDAAYGRATGEFLTKLLRALRARWDGARLLTVGADYSGTADTDYLKAFRAVLDPAVEVMWTGTTVFAKNFDPAQARAYGKAIGRTPLVWDNWTVNDLDGNGIGETTRIYLGPYARKANVAGAVRGFFLNPMNEADLNLLPFATAADFLRDPQGFDARASWLRAVRELGGAQAGALRAFAETSYSTHLDYATEAPTFVALGGRLLDAYGAGGRWPERRAELDAELTRVDGAEGALRRAAALAPFVAEAGPFLAAARVAAGTGRAASALLAAERPALSAERATGGGFRGRAAPPAPAAADALRGELERGDADNRSSRRFVFGYRRPATVDTPPTPLPANTMDVFVDRVRSLDAGFAAGAQRAAAQVTVTLDGRPVALDGGGRFALGAAAAGGTLRATDGAGGATTVVLPARATARPRIVSRHPRRLRGRRVRIVVVCPDPCAGRVRVYAGRRTLGRALLRARRSGRRAVVIRLR